MRLTSPQPRISTPPSNSYIILQKFVRKLEVCLSPIHPAHLELAINVICDEVPREEGKLGNWICVHVAQCMILSCGAKKKVNAG